MLAPNSQHRSGHQHCVKQTKASGGVSLPECDSLKDQKNCYEHVPDSILKEPRSCPVGSISLDPTDSPRFLCKQDLIISTSPSLIAVHDIKRSIDSGS